MLITGAFGEINNDSSKELYDPGCEILFNPQCIQLYGVNEPH